MTVNKAMVFAGATTLVQAVGQMVFTSLGIAQHFCVIDFLKELPLLIYIRILYFHNPDSCGSNISIGQAIDEVAAQAFVLLLNEPFTAFRTFVINCVSLGLSVLWIVASVVILMGGARNKRTKHTRWPWIVITVCVCVLDLVAAVTYANDSFHTRSLSDIMDYIGGTASGLNNAELNTAWAAWTMTMLYSRFVIFFVMNLFLVITMVVECNVKRGPDSTPQVEAPTPAPVPIRVRHEVGTDTVELEEMEETASMPSILPDERIPRPGLSQSFRKMKSILFRRDSSQDQSSFPESDPPGGAGDQFTSRIPRAGLTNSFRRMKSFLFRTTGPPEPSKFYVDSLDDSSDRSPPVQRVDKNDQKRTVNFENMSLPNRLENLIAEQQRRLDSSIIDTSGRQSPPRASQSLPHLDSSVVPGYAHFKQQRCLNSSILDTSGRQSPPPPSQSLPHVYSSVAGRRGTTAGLQGQMPWAYIPASAHRMRDQLPDDEDLPPVPLPDYTAIQSFRKASVHRAASSLSSLTQKKDYASRSTLRPITNSDVLY